MFGRKRLSAKDVRSSRFGVPLITEEDPQNVVSEQFRVLRANIDFAAASVKKFQTVLFTSSEMSDGKSTVAQNLAVTWAQAGKSVLLVDADLRRPTVHRTFGADNTRGLTTILAMNDQPADVIHNTGINGLYVLTSGPMPPNPSELLGSPKMVQLVEWMRNEFDMIVIDSTPLILVPDAQALLPRTDGVVLVATLGKTKKRSLSSAVHILRLSKAKILGLVSRSEERPEKSYGYKYGYGYGYKSTNQMTTDQVAQARQRVHSHSNYQRAAFKSVNAKALQKENLLNNPLEIDEKKGKVTDTSAPGRSSYWQAGGYTKTEGKS